MDKQKRKMVEGWLDKASRHRDTAREHLKSSFRISESIEASQECIELSVKSVLTILNIEFSSSHKWSREQIKEIAKQIQNRNILDRLESQNLAHIRLPRLILLNNFWAQLYLPAKYGYESGNLAPAKDLFDREEAELAVKHADECYRKASELRYLDEEKLATIASTLIKSDKQD